MTILWLRINLPIYIFSWARFCVFFRLNFAIFPKRLVTLSPLKYETKEDQQQLNCDTHTVGIIFYLVYFTAVPFLNGDA
jgi:hypothetical protein